MTHAGDQNVRGSRKILHRDERCCVVQNRCKCRSTPRDCSACPLFVRRLEKSLTPSAAWGRVAAFDHLRSLNGTPTAQGREAESRRPPCTRTLMNGVLDAPWRVHLYLWSVWRRWLSHVPLQPPRATPPLLQFPSPSRRGARFSRDCTGTVARLAGVA